MDYFPREIIAISLFRVIHLGLIWKKLEETCTYCHKDRFLQPINPFGVISFLDVKELCTLYAYIYIV